MSGLHLLPSTLLGDRWIVVESLGAGSFGQVYRVRDKQSDDERALKFIPAGTDRTARDRFARELAAQLPLRHPNILCIHDSGETADGFWFAMDLAQGPPLGGAGLPTIPPSAMSKLLAQLVSALSALHAAGVIHGDLKPENLFWDPVTERLQVGDFGLAGALGANSSGGTPAYMAPELLQGLPPSPAADIYAFALLTWELVAGKHPYPLEPMTTLLKAHVTVPLPALPRRKGLPSGLDDLLQRCAAKSPQDRPSDGRILELLWQSLDREVALPPPGLAGGGLIGRDDVLLAIRKGLSARSPIWVQGNPGIGKAALVGALALEEIAAGHPQALRIEGDPVLALARLERLLDASEGSDSVSPEERLRRILEKLGPERDARVLLWEDLPGDLLSAELLRLMHRLGKHGLHLVATSVQAPSDAGWTLVQLEALSAAQTATLVRAWLGSKTLDSELPRKIHAFSGGIPGATRRLLEEVIQAGVLTWSGREWVLSHVALADWSPPTDWARPSVPDALRPLLGRLSVIPVPFTLDEAEASYGVPQSELAAGLRALLAAGLLAETPRGAHTAYRAVLSDLVTLPPEEHILRAEAWTRQPADMDPVPWEAAAWHLHAAGAVDRAVAAGVKAMDALRRTYRQGEALRWVRRLQEWVPPDKLFRLRKLEGLLLKELGRRDEAVTYLIALLEDARATFPTEVPVVMGDIGVALFESGRTREAADWFRQAAEAEPEGGKGRLRALNNLGSCLLSLGELVQARQGFTEALNLAQSLGDQRMEAVLRANLGEIEVRLGHLDSAVGMLVPGRDQALEHQSLHIAARMSWMLGRIALQLGRGAEVTAELRRLRELAPLLAGDRHAALLPLLEAETALVQGDGEGMILALALAENLLQAQADTEGSAMLTLLRLQGAEAWILPVPEPKEQRRLWTLLRRGTDPAERVEGLALQAGVASRRVTGSIQARWWDRIDRAAAKHGGHRGRLLILFDRARSASGPDQERLLQRLRDELKLYPWAMLRGFATELAGAVANYAIKPLAARAAYQEAVTIWRELGATHRLPSAERHLADAESQAESPAVPPGSDAESKQLWTLLEIIRAISMVREPETLRRLIVDRFIEISGLGRAILFETDGEKVKPVLARDGSEIDLPLDPIAYSRTAIRRVLDDPRPLFLEDVVADEELSARASVAGLGLRSVVVLPLVLRGRVSGLLYADAPFTGQPFGSAQLEVLRALALQAAVMMEQAETFIRLEQDVRILREQFSGSYGFEEVIGRSAPMVALLRRLAVVAGTDVTLFLSGETGTGKDLLARAVHAASSRAKGPFVAINCAAVPEGLLESELFGHEKGAFTGALAAKPGRFELAQGGTLFLDEIGETPLNVQAKLLRVLQDMSFERVGGTRTFKMDVRLIVATNRPIQEALSSGKLREDLYYRIASVVLHLPALRERREDIPELVRHFVKRAAERYAKKIRGAAPELLEKLVRRDWPGNVRELEHLVEQMVVFAEGTTLTSELLPELIPGMPHSTAPLLGVPVLSGDPAADLRDLKRRFAALRDEEEHRAVLRWLEETGGNITLAAQKAGIHRVRLHQLIKKHGIKLHNES